MSAILAHPRLSGFSDIRNYRHNIVAFKHQLSILPPQLLDLLLERRDVGDLVGDPVGCGKPHRVNIAGGLLCQIDFSRQIFRDRLRFVKRTFLAVAYWPASC
jgi:hypothetical protein